MAERQSGSKAGGGQRRKSASAASKSGGSSASKSSGPSRSKAASKSSGGAGSGSRSTASKASGSSSARSGSKQSTAAKRTAAAKRGGQARGRQQKARKRADQAAGQAARPVAGLDFSGKAVADFREALKRGIISPLNLVMLTRDRIEEVLDDAVERGRMTADDAQSIVKGILTRGRRQTDDVLGNLEQLLGRTRDEVGGAADEARKRGTQAASRARKTADPVLAQADRARRAAGVGPSFPITGYDDLTVAQVQGRLDGLSAPELRKVRDYEKRNANRKTVLDAVESGLR